MAWHGLDGYSQRGSLRYPHVHFYKTMSEAAEALRKVDDIYRISEEELQPTEE